jgi:DNA modification methylase
MSEVIDRLAVEQWPIERLLPYARNPRVNDHAVDQMAAVITEFGFRIPVVAKSCGELVDGHLRLKAAHKLGLKTVPVALADDLSEAQIKAFRLLANRSATWANWDDELLKLELDELQLAEFDLSLTGFSDDELQALLSDVDPDADGESEGTGDEDAVPQSPEDPISKLGDVWLLGPHRVLCGDATLAESYDALLQGERVDMIFSDLPYNVNYSNNPKDKLRGTHRPILNDNLGAQFYDFLLAALSRMVPTCTGAIYITMSSSELDTLQAAFRASGGKWSTFIIWVKSSFTLGRADYQRQYEPMLYGWPEGATRHWCGDRNQSDVWQIKKPQKNDLHPTMKPIELMERAILNSSQPGNRVLDSFSGSGSTLIACEKTKRVCLSMELDPAYCDVIIKRWQEFTGKRATHAISGVAFDDACAP